MEATSTLTNDTSRLATVNLAATITAEQQDWVRARARQIGEKPSFIIRELIRKAMAEEQASTEANA